MRQAAIAALSDGPTQVGGSRARPGTKPFENESKTSRNRQRGAWRTRRGVDAGLCFGGDLARALRRFHFTARLAGTSFLLYTRRYSYSPVRPPKRTFADRGGMATRGWCGGGRCCCCCCCLGKERSGVCVEGEGGTGSEILSHASLFHSLPRSVPPFNRSLAHLLGREWPAALPARTGVGRWCRRCSPSSRWRSLLLVDLLPRSAFSP